MDMQLKNKTALVTGSTAGIGLEIARSLAAEGVDITIAGRSQGKLDAAIAEIQSPGQHKVIGVLADAATAEGAEILIRAVPDVDILVNNLGMYESRSFGDITDENWLHMFEVNVLSGVRLARAYFPAMLGRNWGRIIFVSSEAAFVTAPDMIHYGMTKTAQLAVARGLASATKGTGVTVNSVLPGPTRSEGIVDFLKGLSNNPDAPAHEIEAKFFANHRPASLLQRMIEAEEVASAVTYLASPLSAATNGAALRVDGGLIPTVG